MQKLKIGNISLNVEVAKTESEQSQGLMGRKALPNNQGMLFEYPNEQNLSFWMKNTSIPLSIAFIDESGAISEILDLEPFNETPVSSKSRAKYALEVNKGWFGENNINVGDVVDCGNLKSKKININIVKLPSEVDDFAKKLEDTLTDMIGSTVEAMVGVDHDLKNLEITVNEGLFKTYKENPVKITKNLLNKLIKEESKKVLKEGLLEDPIEQSDSIILSMLDSRGFRTRGFMETLVKTIKMTAEKENKDPIKVAEEELARMHRGLDDLSDRVSRTLMTYFPRGAAAATQTQMAESSSNKSSTFKTYRENPVKITKKDLRNLIKEETTEAINEGSGEMLGWMAKAAQNVNKTTVDEAYQMLLDVVRKFYDDNDRLGIVSAIKNHETGEQDDSANRENYPLAIEAAHLRKSIDDLLAKLDKIIRH